MSFNEPSFLFLFLPALLVLYFVIPRGLSGLRNAMLLLASAMFYIWGGKQFIFLLIGLVVANYFLALAIERRLGARAARVLLTIAVIIDLTPLAVLKYARFGTVNLNHLLDVLAVAPLSVPKWLVPLGISFFTFTIIGYIVDVFRGEAKAERILGRLALYLLFFPKIVAGPITRYQDTANQLGQRTVTREGFAEGVRRFTVGLAKKVIIASTVGAPADKIFTIPTAELTPGLAWLGLVCYTIQIYFDFSGYSDMAVGLGKMFGFTLPENFNYPYAATSIRDFWRRWHISLSTWLRDYLYIPLGGSRVASWRVYFNLVTVFVLCGLWHGADWTFIVWGLYFGFFLVLERLGLEAFFDRSWRPLRHLYTVAVVIGSWVLFRAATLEQAVHYWGVLVGIGGGTGMQDGVGAYVDSVVMLALIVGVIGSMPVVPWLRERMNRAAGAMEPVRAIVVVALIAGMLLAAGMWIAANTYAPFIYRQF